MAQHCPHRKLFLAGSFNSGVQRRRGKGERCWTFRSVPAQSQPLLFCHRLRRYLTPTTRSADTLNMKTTFLVPYRPYSRYMHTDTRPASLYTGCHFQSSKFLPFRREVTTDKDSLKLSLPVGRSRSRLPYNPKLKAFRISIQCYQCLNTLPQTRVSANLLLTLGQLILFLRFP